MMQSTSDYPYTPMQRFWKLLKPDRREITNVYIYAIFNGLVYLSIPLGIQAIINLIQGGQVSASWVVLVVIVILGVAITGVLQIFQVRITENLQQKIFTRAAFEFAYRIPRIKMEALYRHYAPELMNRFFDTISVQKGLSKILIDFSTATLSVIFGLLLLSLYHPFFIAFSLILVALVYAIFRFTAQRGLSTSLDESKYKYQVAHWLEELARTNATFKLAGNTDLPLTYTNNLTGSYLKARESHFRILIQQYTLMVVFKVLVATGLLAIGGILVMEQQMNIGQFVAAEIIILMVMSSVEKLILSMETIYDVLTALEKIGQVTDLELETHEGINLQQEDISRGVSIELDNISFAYPGHTRKSLHDVSLHIQSGENIMITGVSDSGKSTLLYLLAGLYDPQEGNVSYQGLPKGNLKLDSLRASIGDCLAHEQIFNGTLKENITMGREAANFENLKWAIANLGLQSFIKKLPKGFDTVLSPGGKELPKGVMQKLFLARSIVERPKLLLLEDALKYIDENDRRQIIDFLTSSEHPWTLVGVSSSAYFARKVDRIAIMQKGKIIKTGTYEDIKNMPDLKAHFHA